MPESSHPGAFFVIAQIPAAAVVGADALIGPYRVLRKSDSLPLYSDGIVSV